MTPKGKKVAVISISLLLIGGVVGYIFWKKAKDKNAEQEKIDADAKALADANSNTNTNTNTNTATLSNFEALQKNLNFKANKDGVVVFKFNANKNSVDFYKPNRFVIGIVGQNGYLKKGTYTNGGLTFSIDGGATFSSNSVYRNLLTALK